MCANKRVADRIASIRIELRMSRSELASAAGMDYQRYCGLERGDRQITVGDLFQIAPHLGTTPSVICLALQDL